MTIRNRAHALYRLGRDPKRRKHPVLELQRSVENTTVTLRPIRKEPPR